MNQQRVEELVRRYAAAESLKRLFSPHVRRRLHSRLLASFGPEQAAQTGPRDDGRCVPGPAESSLDER